MSIFKVDISKGEIIISFSAILEKMHGFIRKKEGDVKYYYGMPFDVANNNIERGGRQIISAEDFARYRIKLGAEADISKSSSWTREAFLYIPKNGVYFTKKSPIIENVAKATDCDRNGNEFYLTNNQIESALEGAVKVSEEKIPVSDFPNHELTISSFGEQVNQYSEFLKDNGIEEIPILIGALGERAFARQMRIHSVSKVNKSCLIGSNYLLCFENLGMFATRR